MKNYVKNTFIAVVFIPLLAMGADLKVTNNTDAPITARLDSTGWCSDIVGGTAAPHKTSILPESKLKQLCYFSSNGYCFGNIYSTENCQGDKIATFEFNMEKGIVRITNVGDYKISGSGFNVVVDHQS